jgi:hypothetical protein
MSVFGDKEMDYGKLRFSGKKEDWPKWSVQFLAVASVKKFKMSLLGKETPPREDVELDEESSDASVKKQLKNRAANERAYSALTLACSETKSFRIVYNAKTKDLPSGNAALAWEKLKTRFEPTSGAVLTQLLQEFRTSQLQKGESPDDWFERLDSIRSRIEQISPSERISDQSMMLHIVGNLPDEYDNIIDRVVKELNSSTLSIDTLQEDLQLKFERMKIRKGDKGEQALFAKQFKGKCQLCGRVGHKRADCWESEANKSKKVNGNKSGERKMRNPNIECFNCHEKGHISVYCPKKNKKEQGMLAKDKESEPDKSDTEYSFTAMTSQEENIKTNYWLGDSGASKHMRNSLEGMTDIRKEETVIYIGNGNGLKSNMVGTFHGTVEQEDGTEMNIKLDDVAFVPELTTNLFSITKAMENGSALSNEGRIMILTKGTKKIKFDDLRSTKNGYSAGVNIRPRTVGENANKASEKLIGYQDAHRMLGHPGQETTRSTAIKLGWTITKGKDECESCPIAKARQKNLNQVADNKVTQPGQLMASDISSIRTDSSTGRKYWLLVVDIYTGMKWSFFLRTKDEQADILVSFVKQVSAKHKIDRWRFDNAGENKTTQKAFEENNLGIKVEYTARETPQQNGTVERAFATLYGRVRSMFVEAGFEKFKREQYWPECAATATKLDNILVPSTKDTSPYEKFYGSSNPIEKHLRTFGEIGVVTKNNNQPIRGKLENRGIPCSFLGYAKDHSANVYRMLKLDTNSVIITRDIVWLKKMYNEYMGMTKMKKYNVEDDNHTNKESTFEIIEELDEEEDEFTDKEQEGTGNNQPVARRTRIEKMPRWQRNIQTFYNPNPGQEEFTEFAYLAMLGGVNEPRSFNEAWNNKDIEEQKNWRIAIRKEFNDMIKRGVWRRMSKSQLPTGRTLIGNKWVFKKKKNGTYRARLVALGYSQVPGVDFTENYAPVVNDITMRVLLVLKMLHDWSGEIIDVETAFLYGELEEEIYMTIPKGLSEYSNGEDLNNECVILKKSIYGLVQAARAWWKKFTKSLQDIGFARCLTDNCLMMRKNADGIVILCIYVDDVCCFGDKVAIAKAINEIEQIYSIKRIGELSEFIGVNIEINGDTMNLSQNDTMTRLEKLFKEEIKTLKNYDTPAGQNDTILRPTENETLLSDEEQSNYRSGVGTLLWLMKHSRPDIANAVREASKVMDGATKAHWKYLLRIIKYVIDTRDRTLQFTLSQTDLSGMNIEGFCDSDYAGDRDTRKSVAGFAIYLLGCLIVWKSKSQKSVTLSSSEAEYVSISEIAKDLLFVKQVLEFLDQDINYPMKIRVDNVGAIYMAENGSSNNQTKHVNTRYHFVRELIEEGTVTVEFVKSQNNDSDIFTKNLGRELFQRHSNKFMGERDKKREKYKKSDDVFPIRK